MAHPNVCKLLIRHKYNKEVPKKSRLKFSIKSSKQEFDLFQFQCKTMQNSKTYLID